MPYAYYGRPSISPVVAGLFAAGIIKRNHAVLDAGCGGGTDCATLESWGIRRVDGIDHDDESLRKAWSRLRDKNVELHEGSLTKKHDCFRDRYFDVVLDTLLFNNLRGRGIALYLQEIARVLKPGGLFVLQYRTGGPRLGVHDPRVTLPPTFRRYFVASRSVATFLVEYAKQPRKKPGASKRVLVSIVVARRRARRLGNLVKPGA